MSPLLQDTVLRGTFNSTLNNPVVAKLRNRALREEKLASTNLGSGSIAQAMGSNENSGEVTVHT